MAHLNDGSISGKEHVKRHDGTMNQDEHMCPDQDLGLLLQLLACVAYQEQSQNTCLDIDLLFPCLVCRENQQ